MSDDQYSIRAEALSKRYFVAGKRQENARLRYLNHFKEYLPFTRDSDDYFWALKDVSFEVTPGQIMGVLGKNGSGKSTLLKILSRVTSPTSGYAKMRGRVGSLLEVGTGFHPDLSGRDNVYMSGVLLGLTRAEVHSKFDEIVDFSGIGQFIDVPVKRYSSGMYVRLAYAVASLLRCDIMILDEVMAVGDLAFQEKSQENIKQLARNGQTILFVSHNIRSVASLCTHGFLLDHGEVVDRGGIKDIVATYSKLLFHTESGDRGYATETVLSSDDRGDFETQNILRKVAICNDAGEPCSAYKTGKGIRIYIEYKQATHSSPYFAVMIYNENMECVGNINSCQMYDNLEIKETGVIECYIPKILLGHGTYNLSIDYGTVMGHRDNAVSRDFVSCVLRFTVDDTDFYPGFGDLDSTEGAAMLSDWQSM